MKNIKMLMVGFVLVGLSGCATTNKDPLEGLNRGIYKFNDVTDKYALQPVAKGYKAVTPSPVRAGVSNFFSNLGTLTTIVNDLLQLKFAQAFTDAGRFVINSTFGVVGLIDVASMDNIPKHNEDFGQTLGYWGVGSGAYLVLPILGPSTVRDAGGLVFDTATSDPITYLHNIGEIRTHNQVRLVQLLDKRTQLLDATDLVDNASIDPYAFMRDAYLQRRASLIQDGLVPKELLQDDFEPADEEPANKTSEAPSMEPASAPPVIVQSDLPLESDSAGHASEGLPASSTPVAETLPEVPALDRDPMTVDAQLPETAPVTEALPAPTTQDDVQASNAQLSQAQALLHLSALQNTLVTLSASH